LCIYTKDLKLRREEENKKRRREQEEKREQLARYMQHIANASRSVIEPFQGNGRVFDAKHVYLPCIQS
jgi:hypothetical protein